VFAARANLGTTCHGIPNMICPFDICSGNFREPPP
jgi:hypothetical protein